MQKSIKRHVLAQAIVALETEEECDLLLEDICTIKEIEDMAHRFEIAFLLSQGHTFIEVEKTTGASSATISRVNRCLKHGKGYRQIIEKMEKNKK
jgi:TrpR-related protein YerC/YecD